MSRILLVDDDEIIVGIVCNVLADAGHEVRVVAHGDEAIAAVESFKPDLLILDHTLPGRSGRDILRELRAKQAATILPVMMLTSRHGRTLAGIAEIDGADDYVTKPFDPIDLRMRVNSLLVDSTISRRITGSQAMDHKAP